MLKKAVVLSSGGLDSTTAMAIAKNQGFEIYSISFDYGQKSRKYELRSAKKVAIFFNVKEHKIIKIDLRTLGGSALTDIINVPKRRSLKHIQKEIPVTYVPARNTIFLSIALAYAEVIGSQDIFIGINAIDYSGYPDCRPKYIKAFQNLANLALKMTISGKKIKIYSPLINLKKSQIIKLGIKLGVNYGLTHTCYDPDEKGRACGECDSCVLRIKGFKEANLKDPITYRKNML